MRIYSQSRVGVLESSTKPTEDLLYLLRKESKHDVEGAAPKTQTMIAIDGQSN
jgi:hypothetical protein